MAGAVALTAICLAVTHPRFADPAYAFAPQAAAAVAKLIPSALPPAARWNPTWGGAAAAEVEQILQTEDLDPEAYAAGHRFVSGNPPSDPQRDDGCAGTAAIVGAAPYRFLVAAHTLRDAFVEAEDWKIVRGIAELAVSATNLADPFQVTSVELEEIDGARARFSDLLEPKDLAGLVPGDWAPPADPIEAGLALAAESARLRPAVEDAVRSGDEAGLMCLRRKRLQAALAAARAVALAAWQAARSPSIDVAGTPLGAVRVHPNPAREVAILSFVLPQAGETRLEVFDPMGRRVLSRDLGFRPAGPQGAAFSTGLLHSMRPGLYLVRIVTPFYSVIGRLVRVSR
jgi:hypothetical protein